MKKEQKERYEEPQTRRTQVILESGICAASSDIKNPQGDNGEIQEHKVNTDFDFDFQDNAWDR